MESESQIPNPNEIPKPNSQPGSGSKGKPYDLRERTFEFAVRVLEITSAIPREGAGRILADHLARSCSSIGANVEEARYWLRLIDRIWGQKVGVRGDIEEARELLYILSAIIDKLA